MLTTFLAFGMPAAPEWIFIGILALVLFGPKKLPEFARGVGKALAELQKAKEDFHREITGVPPMPTIKPAEGREGVESGSLPETTVHLPEGVTPAVTITPTRSEEKKG